MSGLPAHGVVEFKSLQMDVCAVRLRVGKKRKRGQYVGAPLGVSPTTKLCNICVGECESEICVSSVCLHL